MLCNRHIKWADYTRLGLGIGLDKMESVMRSLEVFYFNL